ncbi:ABC transporter ATP-binding protein [Pandoraea cepalis]|uniref:ABC transporter ATP-binding protein n=2 Tax=Pandoraea cepalis TaxID=2508294 RepID=A0A5E4UCP7_9BURK|nr:ABC transporter ATP-binding protein [Pandoraea cepalis]MDN4580564.1 ABC transporter ATP-binding protein [Pandoraea cepalis]VVD97837.1 High-affinity branched-chain amino acid transport ATP-binding protein LivF [Pandoraea cepalis]
MTASLVIEGVEAGYGDMQVLWGVDMRVEPGQTVLLLGANSAGKTTLLRTLIGLLPCTGGRITLDGERIDMLRPDQRIRRGIAFMSELGVFPTLSIDENIALGGYFMPEAKIRQRKEVLFALFPALAAKRRAAAASLSGGQRKMLGIAKVLIAEPRLLLMDEPSSGLAPVFVKHVIDALRTAIGDGTSLLIAEQNIAFLDLADRGYLLDHGKVRVSGSRAELEASDAVRETYFGL